MSTTETAPSVVIVGGGFIGSGRATAVLDDPDAAHIDWGDDDSPTSTEVPQ